jgi:hypothetical protein
MSRRLPRYPLQTYTDALRSLAKSVDIDRDELIKRNIDAWREYVRSLLIDIPDAS